MKHVITLCRAPSTDIEIVQGAKLVVEELG
jgi:hypothetical protein